MNEYFYLDCKGIPFKVVAKRRPSVSSIPKSGTWIVKELYQRSGEGTNLVWSVAGEVTYGTLNNHCQYIGKLPNLL